MRGVLKGYDNTIMCYGQTGSGKTHTMFGSDEVRVRARLNPNPNLTLTLTLT